MNICSVSEITKHIKQLFEYDSKLAAVFVRGEISNFKRHFSGHCYFTLKDSNATVKVVMFKSRAQFMKFAPADGMKVIVGGQITIFERDGQYQLYAQQLLPEGIGELSLAFSQLKEKLEGEGLFDDVHKKPLPVLPKAVGIITSATGAVLRDIITVSKRRHPAVVLKLYPVLVQGTEAPLQIVHAIEVFNKLHNVDVIIVGRGGGSIEDLWAFNDERVVRGIAASTLPIVAAVGHQTDYTLTDFVADRRAATPSQAAEFVVPDVRELNRYVNTLKSMLENNVRSVLRNNRLRVEQATGSQALKDPYEFLTTRQQLLDSYRERLDKSIKQNLMVKQHQFSLTGEKLTLLNPLAVLSRGYSIVRDTRGQSIYDVSTVKLGEKLEIIINNGIINVDIMSVQEGYYGTGKEKG